MTLSASPRPVGRPGGKMQFVVARGRSMFPLIREGDILGLEQTDYAAGDIVTVRKGDFTLTHRLIQTDPMLLTKGDNLPFVDQQIQPGEIIGVARFVIRPGSRRLIQLGKGRQQTACLRYSKHELYWVEQCGRLLPKARAG